MYVWSINEIVKKWDKVAGPTVNSFLRILDEKSGEINFWLFSQPFLPADSPRLQTPLLPTTKGIDASSPTTDVELTTEGRGILVKLQASLKLNCGSHQGKRRR
ncbi:uracil phosphoribosyltransferase [Sesbania bispinosa]|nr:uracil phosphoribosyltransferase [Sesbania bispinosa]